LHVHRRAHIAGVGRDYKNVSTDITLLQRLGLVRLEVKSGKGRAQVPTVPYDEIQVTIDLRQPHTAHAA
jgi:predicted transcriptional regulator